MSTVAGTAQAGSAAPLKKISLWRLLAAAREGGSRNALESAGRASRGALARVGLGPFRPYLVTEPRHAQHILRDNAANYPRGAMMYGPVRRLVGDGIAGEGPGWKASRDVLATVFAGQYINKITDDMADTVERVVDDLLVRAADRPVDADTEMIRIVHHVVSVVFFGGRIPVEESDRLGAAITAAWNSIIWRMAMPFVPDFVPMPGDRTFRRTARLVDEKLWPLVQEGRRRPPGGEDVVSRLIAGLNAQGEPFTDQQVRDDVVSLFVSGSETTALAMTWLWVVLDDHPEVAERLYEEIDRVVGQDKPRREHVRQLTYTQMVLYELLRVYSVGWALPRVAKHDDVIDGVPIKAGSTLVISPYLVHRNERVWERPEVFDPERFSPERNKARIAEHGRFAYLAFGLGDHSCLGEQFFKVEASLTLASLLRRARPRLHRDGPVEARLGLTLRPRRPVKITLDARS
jgi:cytochrome P450